MSPPALKVKRRSPIFRSSRRTVLLDGRPAIPITKAELQSGHLSAWYTPGAEGFSR